jgi:3-(3-hydroxy-phenyl)propionate hydroxylase
MNKVFDTPLYPYARTADQDAEAPVRHAVAVIGAGPVGLAVAIDLAQRGVEVVVLDDNTKVSFGSRAICFSKRTLEICDRLGVRGLVEKGVVWNFGKVFFGDRKVYEFNLLPEGGHRRPAFINLQQYHFEHALVARVRELEAKGAPVSIRGGSRVTAIEPMPDGVGLSIDTVEGPYRIEAEWVIACDGANSPTRTMMGLDFTGRVFEDNFLIADVVMDADFPTERWFWFDPPFNPGQSALLHKQPDGVWRIDLQLGWDIDREAEKRPENVIPRLKAMLGEDVTVRPRMGLDLHLPVSADGAVPAWPRDLRGRQRASGEPLRRARREQRDCRTPTTSRGSSSSCWTALAPDSLLDSYDTERIHGRGREHPELHPLDRIHHAQVGAEPHLPRRGAGPWPNATRWGGRW